MNKIFKFGGGAAIGSHVIVVENNAIKAGTDFKVIRRAYEEGENLFVSVIEQGTEAALVAAEGYIGSDDKLYLAARDFDDNKTYKFVINGGTATLNIVSGIDIGGSPLKQVVANPTLAGTEAALEGLQVGTDKYKVGAELKDISGTVLGNVKFVKCTQAEYNALATKDASTIYMIVAA